MTMEFIDLNPDRDFTFSSCVRAGDFIYTSHHGGLFDDDGNIIESIEAQTEQCFRNLVKTIEAAGASLKDIVKTTVLLRSLDDFMPMREVYRRYFTDRYPVRTAIFTDFFDEECRIQIDVVAYRPVKVKSSCL
jgi:2-iminobutanoate/2-iminopropanoate deaminase